MHTPSTIRFQRTTHHVLERMRIGDATYAVVAKLGSRMRPIYQAIELGYTNQMRCIHLLPLNQATKQSLSTLRRVSLPIGNLPVIVKTERHGDQLAVITKWVDGPTLHDYLRDCRNGREPCPSALIVMRLIRGLAHACGVLHNRLAVLHGDIHPGNIVLCRHTKKLVLIDFGSAWQIECSSTRAGDGVALGYAAPEAMTADEHVGYAADQFSVMAVAYELLCGQLPYDGLGGKARVFADEAPINFLPPSQHLRHSGRIPRRILNQLDTLFFRSLSLFPNERFPNTRSWADAIHELAVSLGGKARLNRPASLLVAAVQRIRKSWVSFTNG